MKSSKKFFFLAALFTAACSRDERIIDNSRDGWQMIASSATTSGVKLIEQPGPAILRDNIFQQDSANPAAPEIRKIFSFRDQIYLVSADTVSNKIFVLDRKNFSSRAIYDFGEKIPSDMCFANGTTAYICHENTDSVSVVDILNNTIAWHVKIRVGHRPTSIAALGNQIYVANQGDNTVSVIDSRLSTNPVVATIPVAPAPTYVRPDSIGGQMVVLSLGSGKISSGEKTPAKLTLINAQTRQIAYVVSLYESAKDSLSSVPQGLAVTDKQYAFIPLQKAVISADIKRKSAQRKAMDGSFSSVFYNGLRQELLFFQNSANSTKIITADPLTGAKRSDFTLPFVVQGFLPL